jgi:protein involved in polysaccharide export with SLBB domain
VLGHVNSPGPIALKDRTVTISKAIAIAGGPSRDGKTSDIKIIRQLSDADLKKEIVVDLAAIKKQKAEDIILLPNDVVEVGASTGKTILNMLTGAVPSAVTQGAVRAIP